MYSILSRITVKTPPLYDIPGVHPYSVHVWGWAKPTMGGRSGPVSLGVEVNSRAFPDLAERFGVAQQQHGRKDPTRHSGAG